MLKKSSDGSVLTRSGQARKPWWFPLRVGPKDLGRWGEWIALKHLRRLGWDIIAQNWKGLRGEVDLIAYDGPFLVFVEVKTRRLPNRLPPEDNVGTEKEKKLDQLAFEFLLRYEISDTPVRIDVIGVETPDVRHFLLRHYMS
ncbi:YraN family protein [Acidobacteria bacterium AH-259-G07]|nr:YraN family protein [Acidobacteria bacterium AH-259-G07]